MKRLIAVTLIASVLLAGPAFAGDKEEEKGLSQGQIVGLGLDLILIQDRQVMLLNILKEIVKVLKQREPPTCKGLSTF